MRGEKVQEPGVGTAEARDLSSGVCRKESGGSILGPHGDHPGEDARSKEPGVTEVERQVLGREDSREAGRTGGCGLREGC